MEDLLSPSYSSWEPVSEAFLEWLGERERILEPGLAPEPTIKVLTFLALLESNKACTYDEIRAIFRKKMVIKGTIPDNTLRTSVLNLGKTLEKFGHALELRSLRGRFQLITRTKKLVLAEPFNPITKNVLILDDPVFEETEIAKVFVEKSMIPFHGVYCFEWSARSWENYSRNEAEIRVPYESAALEKLGIQQRLFANPNVEAPLCIVSLGPSEGLAEIALLKKLFNYENKKIHYLAVESSPRLLRNHMGLLKASLTIEIENEQLLCAGVVADIFSNLRETIRKARNEFKNKGIISAENEFLPPSSSLLITYFGNCLGNDGNNAPEAGFFSMVHSIFPNRPLEILVGVSVMRSQPDEYKRNWDDFLLQTPKYLLETTKLFESSKEDHSSALPEFTLSNSKEDSTRCPPVVAEPYVARHQIEGQIYRFYYKLAFDLKLNEYLGQEFRQLPKGTLILLYNIIKYNMHTLVLGIEKIGLFKVKYDPHYHQVIKTANGEREYAVFSAYIEE